MRIISGQHKGRRIMAPKRLPVRPTSDMAKEALFNILNNQIDFEGISVLDLFSGTGNISYEFASRGAAQVTAVDIDPGCAAFTARTAKELEMPINAIKNDVFKHLERTGIKADIIFVDPPYNIGFESFVKVPKLVFQNNLLNKEGLLIIEHSDKTDLSNEAYFKNFRKYGGSVFSFFQWD
ncbi:MAG: methyltransferase domain-containing protein [Flavobacteriales bacterium]|nr:MAG: methyltransferase domain-containing protein [Flavobacteriales bacterium]